MIGEISSSFVLGLLTPLTALCVLPLYPGFISYLSKQFRGEESRRTYALFGLVVATGVLSFMLLVGLVFSTLLQQSLTSVIETVSPIAFGVLGLVGLALLADLELEFGGSLSNYRPEFENPLLNAFGFGFFFGAIVIPCNPAFISIFLGRALLFSSPVSSILNFSAFGLGIGFPLVAFTVISSRWRDRVLGFLKKHNSVINRASGLILLTVSIYYLTCVFTVVDLPFLEPVCSSLKLVAG